ncbi:hypothetical protein [Moorena producens]|nr:hypothetical protein [Moorena producens]
MFLRNRLWPTASAARTRLALGHAKSDRNHFGALGFAVTHPTR